MRVLVIIPAYNEQDTIRSVVAAIAARAPGCDYLIVNDGSTDGTLSILQADKLCHVNLPINLGIGGGVQTGYRYALENGYDIAVQIDGDGQHDPVYIPQMVRIIEEGGADLVIGSRFIEKEGFQTSFLRRVGIGFFGWLIHLITGLRVTDATSGFRAGNRRVIELFARYYPADYPEPETVVMARRCGCRIAEMPVIMFERGGGRSSINMQKSVYYMIKVTLAILIDCLKPREEVRK